MPERSCFWRETEIEIEVFDASLLAVLEVVKHSEGIHPFVCSQLGLKRGRRRWNKRKINDLRLCKINNLRPR